MSGLPLSKTLDPADLNELAEELAVVDQHFAKDREQHPMRRWEYAMALRAYDVWAQADYEAYGHANRTHGGRFVDVGGAGSPFYAMLGDTVGANVTIIDPDYAPRPQTLAQHVRYGGLCTAVFCLSVLEHVDDLDQFLYHLGCLVAPGGLLFLTCDFTDDDPYPQVLSDTKHFHWMRQRIFNEHTLTGDVIEPLLDRDFTWLGERDLRYCGDHVFDYSFCSLALVKRA